MNFDEIIKKNKSNVKSIIRLITKQDNEDIEQEVYIKIWKNKEKYREKGSLKSWVNTIAKNTSKDYLKSAVVRNEQNSTSDEFEMNNIKDKKYNPEDSLILSERQRIIINAIDRLKPKFKEVIMLCEIDGYTYESAAKRLNCPVGTIKSRIYNAKKDLAIELKDLL